MPVAPRLHQLADGEAVRGPAFDPVARWKVERRGDKVFVTGKEEARAPKPTIESRSPHPSRIVIVRGGAAGFAAAEMLRRQLYQEASSCSATTRRPRRSAEPLERLSRRQRAGEVAAVAAEELVRQARRRPAHEHEGGATRRAREVELSGGDRAPYDRLLLATGAEPARLAVPGADQPHVHVLRTFQDSRDLVAASQSGRRAVVIGASFIGLRPRPRCARATSRCTWSRRSGGPSNASSARSSAISSALHEEHGVVFHLRTGHRHRG